MTRFWLLALMVGPMLASRADAGIILLKLDPPKIPMGKSGTIKIYRGFDIIGGGLNYNKDKWIGTATLTSADDAETKRDKLIGSISPANVKALDVADVETNKIEFANPGKADGIVFKATGTGEADDNFRVNKDDTSRAFINWTGPFGLLDADGMETRFTAGVVTDAGSAIVTLAESDFPSVSDGSIIAQKFYDTLSPMVSSLGVTLTLNGPELDITFLPGSTSMVGGIDFGTTSFDGEITAGIDSIPAATAVPEPSALVMCGTAGLLGLGYSWRHRKRAAPAL
jgi:hypothetical protein